MSQDVLSHDAYEDFSRPPPATIWDLLQLTAVVSVIIGLWRPMLKQQVNASGVFALILIVDVAAFVFFFWILRRLARQARTQARHPVASLRQTQEQIANRRFAFYFLLTSMVPIQAGLLVFITNAFSSGGPFVVAFVLSTQIGKAIVAMIFWRRSKWRGGFFCDNGLLIHGSHFLPWKKLASFRTSEASNRLVVYEVGTFPYRYHEFIFSPAAHPDLLPLLEMNLKKTL